MQDARAESRASSDRSGSGRSQESSRTHSSSGRSGGGRWTLHSDERLMVQQLLGSAISSSDGEADYNYESYLDVGELMAGVEGPDVDDQESVTSADLLKYIEQEIALE